MASNPDRMGERRATHPFAWMVAVIGVGLHYAVAAHPLIPQMAEIAQSLILPCRVAKGQLSGNLP